MNDVLDPVVAEAAQALSDPGRRVGAAGDAHPRYTLFHAANSICSQKVRGVLAYHALGYVGHSVKLFTGETYLPAYVRLRMIGCAALGGALASVHGGTTSTDAGGCDGAVVPTLIDWTEQAVLVDSKRICLHLDAQMPEAERLRPAALASSIDAALAVVDNLPNYQMLMGRTPRDAEQGESRSDTHAAFSQRKVAWCDRYLAEQGADETLVRAYEAKRAKEQSAATNLFSPAAMRAAYDHAEAAVVDLERLLERSNGPWLLGERLTLADLFWGIELVRMKDVGVASYWEGCRPHVERYLAAVEALPAIAAAVIDWPGARF